MIEEADSQFRPHEGMMTVAQQVAHTAQTLDWFIEGASRPQGFDLDFEAHGNAPRQRDFAGRRAPMAGHRLCQRRRIPALAAARRNSRNRCRPVR